MKKCDQFSSKKKCIKKLCTNKTDHCTKKSWLMTNFNVKKNLNSVQIIYKQKLLSYFYLIKVFC